MQTLVDILHVHDGIIHQRTDGDSHTSQAHGIYRKAHIVQGKDGGNQWQRQCHQRDDCGTYVGKEQEKHDDNENTSLQQRLLNVSDGTFDETALTEDVCGNLYVRR